MWPFVSSFVLLVWSTLYNRRSVKGKGNSFQISCIFGWIVITTGSHFFEIDVIRYLSSCYCSLIPSPLFLTHFQPDAKFHCECKLLSYLNNMPKIVKVGIFRYLVSMYLNAMHLKGHLVVILKCRLWLKDISLMVYARYRNCWVANLIWYYSYYR